MKTNKDGSIYWEKSDLRGIKDGTNEAFRKIEHPELDALEIVAYEEIDCPRANAILFSTRKEARGATYLWWTSAFISERERNLAIDNTITLAKMGMRHTIIKLRIVAPDSMCGRGFTIFHNEGWKPKFALKENWGRNVFYK